MNRRPWTRGDRRYLEQSLAGKRLSRVGFQVPLEFEGAIFLFEGAIKVDLPRGEFGSVWTAALIMGKDSLLEIFGEANVRLFRVLFAPKDINVKHAHAPFRSAQLRRARFAICPGGYRIAVVYAPPAGALSSPRIPPGGGGRGRHRRWAGFWPDIVTQKLAGFSTGRQSIWKAAQGAPLLQVPRRRVPGTASPNRRRIERSRQRPVQPRRRTSRGERAPRRGGGAATARAASFPATSALVRQAE